VPTLVTPCHAEQHMWASTLHKLGVSPAPIPQRLLTTDNLSAAIATLTSEPGLRHRAEVIGTRVRAEDGVARAVAELEPFLDRVCRIHRVHQQVREVA
jgi:sterol 3beta-glucosyltransferase